ncbi:MAG: MATE family efflux transporter [Raineya sp.]|nr:MATE family efflux transporter [Raineya sp.]MDW8296994.1 MATE family efflux transporter [Raineya sp.]
MLLSFYKLYRFYRFEAKKTFFFSIPIIFAQLGVVLMGVIDVIMIKDLGLVATAAAGATNDVFFLICMLSLGSMNIIAPLVSQAYQKKDDVESKKVFFSGWVLAFILGSLTMLILQGIVLNFEYLRQTPAVTQEARRFLAMLNWSVLPILFFLVCKQFTDGLSLTKVAMTITWIGLGANVFFNWLLIGGNWGFPAMGLEGAGLATVLARLLMLLLIMIFIITHPKTRAILRTPANNLTWKEISKVFRLGLPVGVTYFLEVAAFSVAGLLIGNLDHYSQAAHRVVISLVSTTYMITSGIGIGSAIRMGQAFAEQDNYKMKKVGISAIILAVLVMGSFCLLFLLIPETIVVQFIENDRKAVDIAISLLIIGGIFQISDGVQAVGLGILRGMEDVNVPTMIALIAYWLIALPIAIFSHQVGWGAVGIWIGLLLGLSTSAFLLTKRFLELVKKKKKYFFHTKTTL